MYCNLVEMHNEYTHSSGNRRSPSFFVRCIKLNMNLAINHPQQIWTFLGEGGWDRSGGGRSFEIFNIISWYFYLMRLSYICDQTIPFKEENHRRHYKVYPKHNNIRIIMYTDPLFLFCMLVQSSVWISSYVMEYECTKMLYKTMFKRKYLGPIILS